MKRIKKILLKTIFLLLTCLTVWALASAVGSVLKQQSEYIIYEIHSGKGETSMISEDDIKVILDKDFNQVLVGEKLSEIDIKAIESRLGAEPNVESVDVFLDVKGHLRIVVHPRIAALRVHDRLGNQYYIDVNGIKFPLSRHFTPRVPVLSGDIPPFSLPVSEMDDRSVIKQAFKLWELITFDSFLEALVEQIYVDEEGDLILIPKVGTHKIIFGRFDDSAAERLENLKIFYQEGMPYEGWDKYKSLSIKYRDQVVAVAH